MSIESTVLERARSTAERRGGCLLATEWVPMRKGYVRVSVGARGVVMLHRLALEQKIGRRLSRNETADHQCHNDDRDCPGGNICWHRRCINPDHLVIADAVENWRRGRQGVVAMRRAKTHCPQGHPYEEQNLRASKTGARGCKACHRAKEAGRDPAKEPTYL